MKEKLDLLEAIERTKLRGKSVISMDDIPTRQEMLSLFEVAKYLEPFGRTGGLNLLPGKVLASLAFEPSTRTMLGFEAAMQRLGGSVLAQHLAALTSRIASGETLKDTIITLSKYVHIISMRHSDAEVALEAVQAAEVPILSGGFGSTEHPFQACSDLYTIWRTLGKIDGLSVLLPAPEITSSRVAHSLLYALAKFNTKIELATETVGRIPEETVERLKKANANFSEFLDPSAADLENLILSSDIVYLPSWCRGLEEADEKEAEKKRYIERGAKYYLKLEYLEKAKKERGKPIYVMHPGARTEYEVDFRIDQTEHTLYWEQVEYSLPVRMAIILSVLYGT